MELAEDALDEGGLGLLAGAWESDDAASEGGVSGDHEGSQGTTSGTRARAKGRSHLKSRNPRGIDSEP